MTVSKEFDDFGEFSSGFHILFDLFSSFASNQEEIRFVANPGNAGDSLIALATIIWFNKLGIKFTRHYINHVFGADDIVVYGGGGNFVPMYSDAANFIKNNLHVRRLILLPHTISGNVELLGSLGSNAFIFARERVSFRHIVNSMSHPENCFIGHDLALSLDCSDIKTGIEHGHLNAFREDTEKTSIVIPGDNVDLSSKFQTPGCTTEWNEIVASVYGLMSAISNASSVSTNRLHIAILASLLNKKTKFYDNSYYKNKAVYEYSLQNKFPLTKFMAANEI